MSNSLDLKSLNNKLFIKEMQDKILQRKSKFYHIEKENEKLKNLKQEIADLEDLFSDIDVYLIFLRELQDNISKEYNSYKNRLLNLLEQPIEGSLAHIFPTEGFKVKMDCKDLYRKNVVTLKLQCKNGRESLVSMGQGKLCQELVSFSSNKAICSLLGAKGLYMDETFAASSPVIASELGKLLNDAVNENFQIFLVDQHSDIYKDIPRREIQIKKDADTDKTVVLSVLDY